MPTPTEPTVIKLTYHPAAKGGYTITSEPSPIRLKPGERVTFQATVAGAEAEYKNPRIRIIFQPTNRFQPCVFFTGDAPVEVTAASQAAVQGAGDASRQASRSSASKKGMLRCGLVDENDNLIAPETGHGVDL